MIKNERQYKITKTELAKLEQALSESGLQKETGIDPLLLRAEQEGIRSQMADLRAEVREYDVLREGKFVFPSLSAFVDFPAILIKARIARGLTQKELATKLGLKEQQIQKYEATDYASANFSRIKEVARALGIDVPVASTHRPATVSLAKLINRLKAVGIDRELILRRVLPPSLADTAIDSEDAASDSFVYQVAYYVGKVFGWSPQDIVQADKELIMDMTLAPVKLKVAANANERRVNAYVVYTHYLALILIQAARNKEPQQPPENPYRTRDELLGRYGSLTLESVMDYLWDLGYVILPLNDQGAFHGAYFRENYRHVIVLKQKTSSSSRWMFDALHEAYHSIQEPKSPNVVMVDSDSFVTRQASKEELTANQYAGAVLLGKNPQRLAEQCLTEAGHDLRMLKSAVQRVASSENVPVDSLANYLAYRLSLQGQNWWGAAENLQASGPDPFAVAKGMLLQHVDLSKLAESDIQIVQRALLN